MTGSSRPASTSSVSAMRSERDGCETNSRIRCDTNGDTTTAWNIRGSGPSQRPPDVPLLGMSVPPGASARRSCDSGWFATLSRIRS